MADDEDRTEQDDGAGGGDSRAQEEAREVEKAKEEMHELEEGDPPEKLEDWPDGKAKYLTYGGPEGTAGYDEGATKKLGPSSLEHQADGSVTIEGEQVDNPEDYKSDEPIPGAPTSGKDEQAERGGDSGFSDTDDDGAATRSEAEESGDPGETAKLGGEGPESRS